MTGDVYLLLVQSIVDQLKTAKAAAHPPISNREIAERTGVPQGTVDRVFGPKPYNFTYETLKPLMDYFGLAKNDENREVSTSCEECVKIKEMEATIQELRTQRSSAQAPYKEQVHMLQDAHAEMMEEKNSSARNYRHTIAILSVIIALLLILIIVYLLYFDLGNPNYGIFRY